MIAKLEFQLPEEYDEFMISSNGIRWALAVLAIDNELRRLQKHENQEKITITEVRELITSELNEQFLSLEQIP